MGTPQPSKYLDNARDRNSGRLWTPTFLPRTYAPDDGRRAYTVCGGAQVVLIRKFELEVVAVQRYGDVISRYAPQIL